MTKRVLMLFCAAAVGAGSAAGAALGDGGPSPGVSVGWDGVAAPGGEVRYVALPALRSTVVAAVRIDGGRVVRFASLRGSWGIPLVAWDGTADGLSADGKTLVLAQPRAGAGLRAESRFVVLAARTFRRQDTVTLRGDFEFDVLSPDARTLYLIERVSARDLTRYRVRAYDVEAKRLLPRVIADLRERTASMSGQPLARVSTADGGWAYTLYRYDGGRPFIHALDTRRAQAVCIDLPWHGSQDRLWRLRMNLSPDERQLVLRWRDGAAAFVVDTRTFRVLR